jgi:hypothetical protein
VSAKLPHLRSQMSHGWSEIVNWQESRAADNEATACRHSVKLRETIRVGQGCPRLFNTL